MTLSNLTRFLLATALILTSSCANFRNLARDLKLSDEGYTLIGQIENMPAGVDVRAGVIEWDRSAEKIISGDVIYPGSSGIFGFIVNKPTNCYAVAYADSNGNKRYDSGEPAWIHGSANNPEPVLFDPQTRRAKVTVRLSTSTRLPEAVITGVRKFIGSRKVEDVITAQGATLTLGEVADLDEPRFASTSGEEGLWTPASFAFKGGLGIYFLEPYDPDKIPVLFVYGAAGSPQDWRYFFRGINRRRYQPWFYVYPTGSRLEQSARMLNEGIKGLQRMHKFQRLHVVAHSMGGLVARRAVLDNVLTDGHRYINRLVTISTPLGGHEAAEMGVEMAPSVVPSWRDMAPGSSYQDALFKRSLNGLVQHHILFGFRGKGSYSLPKSNDGTVSVASQLKPEAQLDAAKIYGFDEDHVSILENRAVIKLVDHIISSGN